MPEENDIHQLKIFKDGSIIGYFNGNFDMWQVRLKRPNLGVLWYPPRDIQYFKILMDLGTIYGNNVVYNDFKELYNLTSRDIDKREMAFSLISKLSAKYEKDSLDMEIWLCVIYLAMVAEENKEGTKLGKRIKRLGIHRVLLENISPTVAANETRGKPWREIDTECKKRGF